MAGLPAPAAAPWSAPPANSPAAVGLKNGGLSEMTTDIIYPASRQIDGEFTGGRQLEFRWRSDSSRHWLPRESRLHVKYEFKFGETAQTGSGSKTNLLIELGKAAPKTIKDGKSARPNGNIGFTAAPNASLFDSVRYLLNSVSVESQPHYYTTAAAQLLTKVDREGPDTMGSGMLNSKRLDYGRQIGDRVQRTSIDWDRAVEMSTLTAAEDDDYPLYFDGKVGFELGTLATDGAKTGGSKTFALAADPDTPAAAIAATGTTTHMTVETSAPVFPDGTEIVLVGGVPAAEQSAAAGIFKTLPVRFYTRTLLASPATNSDGTVSYEIHSTKAGALSGIAGHINRTGKSAITAGIVLPNLSSEVLAARAAGDVQELSPANLSKVLVKDHPFMRGTGINPKAEILQMGYDGEKVSVEVSEPMFLATHQHPYAIASSDHQMYLQISSTWQQDLLYCSDYSYGCAEGNGGIISPIPGSTTDLTMGQIYCSVKSVEYHAAFISPMVPSIPPSIGIKYSGMAIQQILLNSNTINEQVVVPPSCRAVYLFLRQRYNHVCACAEELGRGGVGYNEFVTTMKAVQATANATGQRDPRLQGRALPHNLQTIKLGTADGWIRVDELGLAGNQGNKAWVGGVPSSTGTAPAIPETEVKGTLTFNKYGLDNDKSIEARNMNTAGTSFLDTANDKILLTGLTKTDLEKEATTHFKELQVQLGSAMAPKQPYTNLNPGVGAVSRMWTDTINAMGKPMGLRAGNMNLSQYCGFENENGPSGARNGSRGLMTILRILNPPNSLSNVLQIRGQLENPYSYDGTKGSTNIQTDAQLELVVATVFDNLMTVEWAPPAEIPVKTMVAPIV